MGFNIVKDGQIIGWTASKYADDTVTFVDDTLDVEPDIDELKTNKISAIKQQAATMIQDTDWQLQRANERDALGIDTDKPLAVYAEREAIRRASNRSESEINELTDAIAINDYVMTLQNSDYPNTNVLTHLEFLRRFTATERVTITASSAQNPALADYMKILDSAKLINLSDADVAAGVNVLEQAGIINAGRASEILQGV